MKRLLKNQKVVSFLFLLFSNLLYADSTSMGIENQININTPLKLQVFEDEKPTEKFILGTMQITTVQGKIQIFLDEVLVSPSITKRTLLKSEHSYSKDGNFEDIIINQNSFSFIMVIGPQSNKIKITGQKNTDNLFYSVNGTGVFKGIYPGDKPVKVEWKQVKKVILRYNEIL